MLRLRQIMFMGIGLISLAACTGEVMQSRIDRPGADLYFSQGARSGEMLTVVVGNPFPAPKTDVEKAVTEAMKGNHAGPVVDFSTHPGPEARLNHRIVMAFNQPPSFHVDALCGDSATIPTQPTDGQLRLNAGYCVGDALYSHAKVRIPADQAQSPDDPRFRHMVASAMRELVPSGDPFDDDDRCILPNC